MPTVCRIPCFCPMEQECEGNLVIKDWTNILSHREVKQVRKLLVAAAATTSSSSSAHKEAKNSGKTTTTTPPPLSPKQQQQQHHQDTTTKLYQQQQQQQWCTSTSTSTMPSPPSQGERKESLSRARDHVEQVKTRITKRTCPNCDTTLVKSSPNGCNKVVCSFCETRVCYCCLQVVSNEGYDHFSASSTSRSKPVRYQTKCPLWSDPEMDQRQEQDVLKDELYRMAQEMMSK